MSEISVFQVSIFGALDIRVDGKPRNLGISGPTRSLLQYLLCAHERPTRRELLMEMFWPETRPERRRSSLNSAIWRIKKLLRDACALSVDASADCVRLTGVRAEGVEIDFVRLETALQAATAAAEPSAAALAALTVALDDCPGTPLDGVDDEWATVERARLSALRMRGMTTAMRMLAALQRYDEALDVGRTILVHEPYRECAFQEILCLHVLNGERVRALRLFDEFAVALESELGIRPMVETRALRNYLASDLSLDAIARRENAAVRSIWGPGVTPLLSSIEHSRGMLRIAG
jgi:DNA-binding SARP family transcriptional activator